ncbi:transposase [Nucisporomicrobium flavum]|uniref:transposase n=1 Tax=Nucisporomicrobium flavum TaxID=2785915 RepID=UPI003C2BC01F
MDGSHIDATEGGAGKGLSPVNRGKPGSKHHLICDGNGTPMHVLTSSANVPDISRALDLLDCYPPIAGRPGRPRRHFTALLADKTSHAVCCQAAGANTCCGSVNATLSRPRRSVVRQWCTPPATDRSCRNAPGPATSQVSCQQSARPGPTCSLGIQQRGVSAGLPRAWHRTAHPEAEDRQVQGPWQPALRRRADLRPAASVPPPRRALGTPPTSTTASSASPAS